MRHHYVPKLLMRRWLFTTDKGQLRLPAYYWDSCANTLKMFPAGLDQIGAGDGLFAFQTDHPSGRDAIETTFFRDVDNSAARVVSRMLNEPGAGLSPQQKLEFSGFLFSLDARRPRNVSELIRLATEHYREGLNQDAEIVAQLAELGENAKPADVWERLSGHPMEDQALLSVQSMTMNKEMANNLVSWPWMVRRDLDALVLSDRPLIRHFAVNDPNTLWAIPLSPTVAWFGSPNVDLLRRLERLPPRRLVNMINVDSAHQCDRYVLSREPREKLGWLARRLKDPTRKTGPEIIDGLWRNSRNKDAT
ncbi:DUF4238 domain-containing protein [Devosia oryzisoli]